MFLSEMKLGVAHCDNAHDNARDNACGNAGVQIQAIFCNISPLSEIVSRRKGANNTI